jgi:hypothetical protein
MKSSFFRILAGLLSAWVAAVCVETLLTCAYTGIWVLFSLPLGNTNAADGMSFIATTALYASAIVSLPAIAFVALPYFLVSNYLGYSSRRYYLWSGSILGLLIIVAVGIYHFRGPGPPIGLRGDVIFFIGSAMITGSAAALAFWTVVRPDRLRQLRNS